MSIQILEDEATIAEGLFQSLLSFGYAPLEPVTTVEQAISQIRLKKPVLIVMDARLRYGRSGLEVAEYVRLHKLNIPIIMLSALLDADTVKRIKPYNPSACLSKPFRSEELYAAVELALHRCSGAAEEHSTATVSKDDLFMKFGTRYEMVSLQEVLYLERNGKYSEIHFECGKKRLLRMSLATFLGNHADWPWLRVHRSIAVNALQIISCKGTELLVGSRPVSVSKGFQKEVSEYFRNGRAAMVN